jgi:hypothetical protein
MAVEKQIWIAQIIEPMYAESSFLDFAQDMTEFVDNNTINLAEAGVDPAVLYNYDFADPIPVLQRTDLNVAIPLGTFDTVNTVVRNIEEKESSYNKMESVLSGHRRSLRIEGLRRAAYNYSHNGSATALPMVKASGANRTFPSDEVNYTGTRKRMSLADLQRMRTRLTLLEGGGNFVAVLHPYHLEDLKAEDSNFNRNYVDYQRGQIATQLEGFTILQYPRTAMYTESGSSGSKVYTKTALGATGVAATNCYSSFFFMENDVMKADGSVEMFLREKDPEQRGDIVGFQKRFTALPLRTKYLGIIVSGTEA